MKTGVLTFHRCINYGSYWQARCLVEGLRGRGHDAVLLDHRSSRVDRKEWRCALQPVLPTPVPRSDRPLYREKMRRFFQAFDQLPESAPFPLEGSDGPPEMERFDLVVVGSDEVWNLRHPWYGGCPLFYGQGLNAERTASYAASFGNYPASEGLGEPWACHLRSFDALSVRDENSARLVREATGVEPALVLDPCLQFPSEPVGEWYGPEEPFALVYGHNFTPSFVRLARRWADERGLPLLSFGYRNGWADRQWLIAGPHDFAHAMARAEAVVTNFFHGCVFSLRNKKPFACERTPYRSIKVDNLMAAVGGEAHLIQEDTPFASLAARLDEPVDPRMDQRIAQLRERGERFMERFMERLEGGKSVTAGSVAREAVTA